VPELPDLTVYVEALRRRVVAHRLNRIVVLSPFVLRSVDPPVESLAGRVVREVERIGKRIVFDLAQESAQAGEFSNVPGDAALFLVLHLMIAGRLKWEAAAESAPDPRHKPARPSSKILLATFEFSSGTLFFTEAGSKKRASLMAVRGRDDLLALDRGGLEPLGAAFDDFNAALVRENHTLKRTLTDPRLFSGIGNAYSDEILHRARLSPLKLTRALTRDEAERLHASTQATLTEWIDRLRTQTGAGFPEKVTAFRPDMAVHGRFRQPCPVCGSPVQRIVYAENECNYCPLCQTGGRLLADRALSRLLKDDWPAFDPEALPSRPGRSEKQN